MTRGARIICQTAAIAKGIDTPVNKTIRESCVITEYVVRGTLATCSLGSNIDVINIPFSHGHTINGKPVLNIADSKVGPNIKCFGICKKLSRPCVPIFLFPLWRGPICPKSMTNNKPLLTKDAFLICAMGGIVRIIHSGQRRQNIYVTADQLKQLGWDESSITDEMVKGLNNALEKYGITTPEKIRHFMSQAMHESGLGIYTKELANGKAYEGRADLGNTQPGDGPKYKGAGYIQLTGRANYQAFADYMGDQKIMDGVDYVSEKYPWEAAGFWWRNNGMNDIVDSLKGTSIDQQTLEISKAVNLGDRYSKNTPNHYEERRDCYERTLEIIK